MSKETKGASKPCIPCSQRKPVVYEPRVVILASEYKSMNKQLADLAAELEACRLAVDAPTFGPGEALSAYLAEWAKASTEKAEIAALKQQLATSEAKRIAAEAAVNSLRNYARERAEEDIGNEESER